MTLPPFDLHRTRSVEEAGELLTRYGDDAAVLCGGTEILLLLKLGFAAYGHLVDVKGIDGLGGIHAEDRTLVIGSTVTHREVELAPIVLDRLPALAAMVRRVANVRVRNVGTLGGNLCFSDPHSDPATFLLALDAEVEYRSAGEATRASLSEFLVGPYETALEHGQLLTSIRIPLPTEGTAIVHRKLAFHERPAATVTCLVRVVDGVVAEVRIGVGSVGARPVRAAEAERALTGTGADNPDTLASAAKLAAEASHPAEDANGSVAYKEQIVRVLVERCFRSAVRDCP